LPARCREIFRLIEGLFPPEIAEEWDNCGLQVGNPQKIADRVLLALDMDEEVLDEALELKAGLVITHHPLLLKGIKQIREDRLPGRLISKIIRAGITVYSAHTNLDSAGSGVNTVLAETLGLTDIVVLKPGKEKFLKLAVFVPVDYCDQVREALAGAGAGWIGNYSHCTFMSGGTGTFKPMEDANPYVGRAGELEKVDEIRVETILPARITGSVIEAMLAAHPYEEVAYDLYPLENKSASSGLGRVGKLQEAVSLNEFALKVKELLEVPAVRCGGTDGGKIQKVAVCGGSGGDLWPLAMNAGADVLVTGDVGYHAARDMLAAGISFVDAGHYGTERIVLGPLARRLADGCAESNLEVEFIVSSVDGNPFRFK